MLLRPWPGIRCREFFTELEIHVILSPDLSGEGPLQLLFGVSSLRRTAEMLLPQGGISMTAWRIRADLLTSRIAVFGYTCSG